jgi:hypothetical protein
MLSSSTSDALKVSSFKMMCVSAAKERQSDSCSSTVLHGLDDMIVRAVRSDCYQLSATCSCSMDDICICCLQARIAAMQQQLQDEASSCASLNQAIAAAKKSAQP